MDADNLVRRPHGRVNAAADMDPGLSSDSLEGSDTDSVCEERQYQSDLQNRIHRTHEVVFQGTEELVTTGRAAEDQGAAPSIRRIGSSYSELRYDPNWRKHQNQLHTSDPDEEDALDVSSIDSDQWPPDDVILDTTDDRESPDRHPYWKPLTHVVPKDRKIIATTKPKILENVQIRKQGAHQDASDKKTQGEATTKDIVEKNKVTLGVRKEKSRSYVHIHKKKIETGTSGQDNEKSDFQPAEDESHLRKEAKLSESMEESGLSGSWIQKKTAQDIHATAALQWDRRAVWEYDHQYMTVPSNPERYRDSLSFEGHYSPEELLQMHNDGLYHRIRRGRHVAETMEEAEDLMEMYMYPRFSQVGALTSLDPGIICIARNDAPRHGQIFPQTQAAISSGEPEPGAQDKGGNQKTRSGSSGMRKKEGRHQKRLKSFLNQEVKLGGLGPAHAVSEEKKEQLKQQKEYAKEILEWNRSKPAKPREIPVTVTDKDKSTRQKSLEYAKKVPRPQPVPKVSNEKSASVPEKRAMSCESLLPQMKLLEDLQLRHEKEKMAVAALNALHIL
ncbi:jhy protein homolog isoform 1-T3 [Anomaloglossus baeobatrachus]|uniref:jhy protein homolog n=1 Tax=Anomaloglossus baeobatrachus TaxID=238106 RepID=UPI003F4F61BC